MVLDCSVYIVDVHGGEPSSGLGGKDIDLIVNCCSGADLERLERIAEKLVADILESVLGRDPYQVLGVPNIVELHSSSEYLFEKYLESGPPYVFRVC